MASAACHSREEFTPLLSLRKKNLSPEHLKTFRKFAKGKGGQKTVHETSHTFQVLGGDNPAEAVFSQAKNQLRRVNRLGRDAAKTVSKSFLAAQWSLHRPGLLNLLQAFRAYQAWNVDRLGVDPYDQLTEDRPWERDRNSAGTPQKSFWARLNVPSSVGQISPIPMAMGDRQRLAAQQMQMRSPQDKAMMKRSRMMPAVQNPEKTALEAAAEMAASSSSSRTALRLHEMLPKEAQEAAAAALATHKARPRRTMMPDATSAEAELSAAPKKASPKPPARKRRGPQ
ncbi:unnamed protein product [Symbiodinium natans]|uniref:Uncharacterized protein n=1 Tax=Symbiodinium natans TaxID=878477 RepID=A0A812SWE7_9DINO|nr:unnamed protein product [Symbiodinium natans]